MDEIEKNIRLNAATAVNEKEIRRLSVRELKSKIVKIKS